MAWFRSAARNTGRITYEAACPTSLFPGEPGWINNDRWNLNLLNPPETQAWVHWQGTHSNLIILGAHGKSMIWGIGAMVLGAAREPNLRKGANLSADDDAFWQAAATFWSNLSAADQRNRV